MYVAARSIDSALAVGVNYSDFSGLVRSPSREIVLASDRLKYDPTASVSMIPALKAYQDLLSMYKDSEEVWNLQINEKTYDPSCGSPR